MDELTGGGGLALADVAPRIYAMWRAVDQRRTQDALPMCAPDFVMEVGAAELDLARFTEFMKARNDADYDTRHILQNMHVTEADDEAITISFVSTVWRLEPGADFPANLVGDVTERWSMVDGVPRLRRRTLGLFCDTRPLDQRGPG